MAMKRTCLTLAYFAFACGGERTLANETNLRFPLVVQARDEAGQMLGGVTLQKGGKVVGRTAPDGHAQFSLSGGEGQVVDLTVTCPEGYSPSGKPISVGLRRLSQDSPPPVFEALCVAELHSVVVGLRAEHGPKLPILYLKQRVGQTDAEGVAHFVLRLSPAETITLTIDTSQNPSLHPQNPTLTFVAPDRDELVLFEQHFSAHVERPKRTPKPGPTRI